MEKSRLASHSYQVPRFAIVGIFNTILDFSILNFLVFGFSFTKFQANIVSASIAMLVSYYLNHRFVFKQLGPRSWQKFMIFILITASGLYLVQNLIIFLLAHKLNEPGDSIYIMINLLIGDVFSKDIVILNFAKAVATIASMSWNYILYSKFVFKRD